MFLSKLEEDKQVLNILGEYGLQLLQRKNEGLEYSKEYEDMLDDFVKWKPDYSDYANDDEEKACKIDYSFKTDGDVSTLGRLQGSRVSQVRLLKKIIDTREKTHNFFYKDVNAFVENCSDYELPYIKYQKVIEMAEQSGLINGYVEMDDEVMENGLTKEVDLTFRYTEKSYSFTHCREKAHISGGKRWTQIDQWTKGIER